jgi:hypothetical protein
MSNYSQTTFFTPKDSLPSGNPNKLIVGAQFDTEFGNIATAIATKYDSTTIGSSPIAFANGTAALPGVTFSGGSNNNTGLYLAAANSLGFSANGVSAGTISSTGLWNIPVPSAQPSATNGTTTANGIAGGYAGALLGSTTSGQSFGLYVQAGSTTADIAARIANSTDTQDYLRVQGNGEIFIDTPTAASNPPSGTFQAGYLDSPQNLITSGNYTLALTDRGKSIAKGSGGATTWTIPANASVPFPVGTTILLAVGPGSGAVTLNITSDTLYWLPSGSTGSRSLGATTDCIATLYKYSSTVWYLTGVGIT